jgi:uncharacterized protein (DUF1501 family)
MNRRSLLKILAGLPLSIVDVDGWDTHVAQGGVNSYLAGRLKALGQAWRDTVVVVISEFGRTFRENGNCGTDHGDGTVYWVLGGAVHGGRIVGDKHPAERA